MGNLYTFLCHLREAGSYLSPIFLCRGEGAATCVQSRKIVSIESVTVINARGKKSWHSFALKDQGLRTTT